MSGRLRLDLALEARGLAPSRSRARDAIRRGTVRLNGAVCSKPGQLVAATDTLTIDDPASRYVSRAALKLIAGLDAAAIDPTGLVCLDVGSSTGGFTQVLRERGAAKIYAVDVGSDQFHPALRDDPRIVLFEQTNARDLTPSLIGDPIDLLVCDISFVSITKVLAAPLGLCRPGARAVLLIKPQFEVGRDAIGKNGIVTDAAAIAKAQSDIIAFMAAQGWSPTTLTLSPLPGGDGNQETIATFRQDAKAPSRAK